MQHLTETLLYWSNKGRTISETTSESLATKQFLSWFDKHGNNGAIFKSEIHKNLIKIYKNLKFIKNEAQQFDN